MKRITLIGDVTTDRPLLRAAQDETGAYDFSPVFSQTGALFGRADLVVANLETVCGGKPKKGFFLCNSPDELIRDMKAGGIGCVTTANNHCLDQGLAGAARTIGLLEQHGLPHTGTRRDPQEPAALYLDLGGECRVALLAATDQTNATNTGLFLDRSNDYAVNLLKEQALRFSGNRYAAAAKKLAFRVLGAGGIRWVKRRVFRLRGRKPGGYAKPFSDRLAPGDLTDPYLERFLAAVEQAKRQADLCIVTPHLGGQFNTEPGPYSQAVVRLLLERGADAVVGHHPHVAQRAEWRPEGLAAYSIGSFNQSPSADYIVHSSLPEYSMALHLDVEHRQIASASFTILKIVEDADGMIRVFPADALAGRLDGDELERLRRETEAVWRRITGEDGPFPGFRAEYRLPRGAEHTEKE